MKININIDMPTDIHKEHKSMPISQKICDYIDICESDSDSEFHFQYLKYMYEKIKEMKKVPHDLLEVMDKLHSFLIKTGSYTSGANNVDLDGKDFFKYGDK